MLHTTEKLFEEMESGFIMAKSPDDELIVKVKGNPLELGNIIGETMLENRDFFAICLSASLAACKANKVYKQAYYEMIEENPV